MKGVGVAFVELSLEPSDRRFRLPSPTRSLLFEFVGEAGPVIFGAVAASAEVETFAPGVRCEASLELWADEAASVVSKGAHVRGAIPASSRPWGRPLCR